MKHFTRLFFLSLIALSSFNLQAQSYDLAVTEIAITPATATGNVPVNTNLFILATLTNAGTSIIPDQSTFDMHFIVDGDTLESINYIFNGALNPGASALTNSSGFELTNPVPTDFCAAAIFTTLTDPNLTNNFSCEINVNVGTSANVDLSADSVAIVAPSNIDGFDVDNGTETVPAMTELLAVFTNNGNVEYLAGYPISYRIVLGSQDLGVSGTLQEDLLPGGSTTRNITNLAIIPNSPQEVGTYNLCVIVNEDDANSNNDTACVAFSIIDTYIPPEPVGVAEVNTNGYNVTFTNDFITVSNVNSNLNASIIDMNGRVIATEMIVEDMRISTSEITSGIYFLQTVNEKTGEVKMNKFSKF
jgi:hypothetical protein